MAQQRAAFSRGLSPRLPRFKQACKAHAGLGAFRTARTAADFADDHQWTDAALGQVSIGAQPWHQHTHAHDRAAANVSQEFNKCKLDRCRVFSYNAAVYTDEGRMTIDDPATRAFSSLVLRPFYG